MFCKTCQTEGRYCIVTYHQCLFCGKPLTSPSSQTLRYCLECSIKLDKCQACGMDMCNTNGSYIIGIDVVSPVPEGPQNIIVEDKFKLW